MILWDNANTSSDRQSGIHAQRRMNLEIGGLYCKRKWRPCCYMFIVLMAPRNIELGKIDKNRHKIFILIGETSSYE